MVDQDSDSIFSVWVHLYFAYISLMMIFAPLYPPIKIAILIGAVVEGFNYYCHPDFPGWINVGLRDILRHTAVMFLSFFTVVAISLLFRIL